MGLTDLTGMPSAEVEKTLRQIVFTAAKDWQRSIKIDRPVRDILINGLTDQQEMMRINNSMRDKLLKISALLDRLATDAEARAKDRRFVTLADANVADANVADAKNYRAVIKDISGIVK